MEENEAQAFARWVEDQASEDEWLRLLYDVQPKPEMPKLQIDRPAA